MRKKFEGIKPKGREDISTLALVLLLVVLDLPEQCMFLNPTRSLDDDDQQQLVGQSNDDDEGEQRQRPQQQQRNNYSILNEDDTEIVLDDSLSPMDEREETRK